MMAAGNPNNWWNNMHMQTPGALQSSTSLPTVPSSSSSSAHGQHGPNNSSLLSLLLHNQYMHGGGGGSSSSTSSSSSSCSSASSSSSSTSSSSSSSLPFSPLISDQHHHHPVQSGGPHQDFPQSWSQLLLGGLASEDQEKTLGLITASKLQENINNNNNSNWGFLAGAISPSSSSQYAQNHQMMMQIKQEGAMQQETQHYNNMISNINSSLLLYGPSDDGHNIVGHQQQINVNINENMQYQFPHNIHITARPRSIAAVAATSALSPQTLQVAASSPKSCVTTLSNNNHHNNINSLLDFSTSSFKSRDDHPHRNRQHSSHECNSGTGAASSSGAATAHVSKKPRAQSSSTPPLKVRKEKLGDRITALHQLVSPFGKTDTASVLLEAIGYIRFLQGQIEVLSSPYLSSSSSAKNQSSAHGGERNCLFPDHPGQLLNDSCMKRRAANYQQEVYYKDVGHELSPKDLRSRGLCLVPISFTQLVGGENGADYWGPSLGGGF